MMPSKSLIEISNIFFSYVLWIWSLCNPSINFFPACQIWQWGFYIYNIWSLCKEISDGHWSWTGTASLIFNEVSSRLQIHTKTNQKKGYYKFSWELEQLQVVLIRIFDINVTWGRVPGFYSDRMMNQKLHIVLHESIHAACIIHNVYGLNAGGNQCPDSSTAAILLLHGQQGFLRRRLEFLR